MPILTIRHVTSITIDIRSRSASTGSCCVRATTTDQKVIESELDIRRGRAS